MSFELMLGAYQKGAWAGEPVSFSSAVVDGLRQMCEIAGDNLPEERYEHVCEAMAWCSHRINMGKPKNQRNATVRPVRMSKGIALGLEKLAEIAFAHSTHHEQEQMKTGVQWMNHEVYRRYSRHELVEHREVLFRGK